MMKVIRAAGCLTVVYLLLSLSAVAQNAPDKAYLQKIWDGWSSLNVANVDPYYAHGSHTFFDDEPLKFDSWDAYKKTAAKELEAYKSGKFTLNNDVQIHQAGPIYWGTATLEAAMVKNDGKQEKGTLRWTFVLEKQGGKWLIVHEHVSAPVSSE